VAKIERSEAIPALKEIILASDVVMVARGDLGVEVGYAQLTGLQKRIIEMARGLDRVTITATQMMESMIHSPVPTRAEVSDVANAVLDGSDAVMLSGESAVGKYPVRAVQAMAEVIEGAEKYQFARRKDFDWSARQVELVDQAIAHAAMFTTGQRKVRAIVALTESGSTPLWMSRIRSDIPIYAFTPHEATQRRVALYRGVYPVPFNPQQTDTGMLHKAIFWELLERARLNEGDEIILTQGELAGVSGSTNTMKLLEVHV
jgi:pyruvate kinase